MHITRLIAIATTVATISTTTLPALAIGPNFGDGQGPKKESIRQRIMDKAVQIRERLQIRKENVQERRQEHQERLSEKHRERLREFWGRTDRRMHHLNDERLRRLAERIGARLDDLETAGKDVSDARASLDEAYDAIAAATQAREDAMDQLEQILEDNEPKEAFEQLRQLHREIMEQIRAAHRALIDTIKMIRGMSDQS